MIPRHQGVLREVRAKVSLLRGGGRYYGTWRNISVYLYTTGYDLLATEETKWIVSYKDNICLVAILYTSREVSFGSLLLLQTSFWSSRAKNAIKLISNLDCLQF